jgi:hypothetical protein
MTQILVLELSYKSVIVGLNVVTKGPLVTEKLSEVGSPADAAK